MATIKLTSALTVDSGDVKTVTSAERVIIRESVDLRWYGIEHPTASQWADDIEACAMAIWLTTGETVPSIMARLSASVDRAYARQEREAKAQAKRLGWPTEVEAKNF